MFIAAPRGDTATPGYHAYVTLHDWIGPSSKLSSAIGVLRGKHKLGLDSAWDEFESGLASWKTKHLILAANAAAEVRRTLGVKVEVLGFTTRAWRGGNSRLTWGADGRPKNPGRLNDLLHIVYREAEDSLQGSLGGILKPMLRPDVLKENIDGEAIEWAAGRLRQRPEARKILLAVSDGVGRRFNASGQWPKLPIRPCRTCGSANGMARDVELLAIGLGYDVDNY